MKNLAKYHMNNLGLFMHEKTRLQKCEHFTMEALLIEELQNHCRRNLSLRVDPECAYPDQGYQDRGTNTGDAYIWVS